MPQSWEQYIKDETDRNATPAFRVRWDNGHACNYLPGMYDIEKEANRVGREWKREMVAIERTERERREARQAYQWEIIEGWCVDGDWAEDNDK